MSASTVSNLTLNNSLLQPYLTTSQTTFNTGNTAATFDVLNYTGTITGAFDSPVVSPLTFDVVYTNRPTNGQVQLTSTGIDFTNTRGNQNQRSLESYLNNFVITDPNTVSLNQDSLPFNLADLTQSRGNYSPIVPGSFSVQTTPLERSAS